ncbi:lipopolysaccharide biosynthesis protein [Vibrio sp. WZ-1]|uniref:lipopolysaccharide biosynthesis protein n=1 Tax=Vibrio sp. WZ-1 TaxID=3454501 RepID=UPI003F824776
MSKAMINMSYFALALIINKSISLLMLPVIPHFLAPAQMGKLELLTSFNVVIALVVCFALNEALFRFVGTEKRTNVQLKLRNNIYTLTVSISFITALALFAILSLVTLPLEFVLLEFVVIILCVSFEGSIGIGTAWLRMKDDKAKTLFTVMVTTTVIQVIFIIMALNISPSVLSVLFGGLIASVVQFIWLHLINRYHFTFPNKAQVHSFLRYSTPIMLAGLMAFCLNGAERWFISANASLETLGIYAIAAKFALGMCILVQPFGMWWMPRRFAYLEEGNTNTAMRITHLGIIYIASLTTLVATLAYIVVHTLLPEAYHDAFLYTLFLLPIAMLKEWYELLNLPILYKKHTHKLLLINAISAGIAVLLLFALNNIGVWGVFISLYIAQMAKLFMTIFVGKSCIKIRFNINLLVVMHLLSGVGLVLVHSSHSVFIAILCCIAMCSIYFFIAKNYMTKKQRKAVNEQVQKWHVQLSRISQ